MTRQPIGAGLVALAPHRGAHRVAVRAAVSLAVPLLVLWGIDRIDLSVYAAFGAFAALYGRHDAYLDRLRMQAAAGATFLAVMLIGTAAAALEAPAIACIAGVAVISVAVTLLAQACGWHPPGALFAVFAAGATSTLPAREGSIADVVFVGGGAVVWSLALTALIALIRGGAAAFAQHAARRFRPVDLLAALGVGIGALLAGIAGLTLVGPHWYWAMVSAVAALGGTQLSARVVRGLHRLTGTLLGVLIAAGVLALELPPLATIAVVVCFQAGAELFIGRNYGVAMVFVTPLALLMIALVAPSDPGELLRDRVVDTVIGVAIGTVIAVLSAAARRARTRHTPAAR